jgi:putative ABC transport system permease protein
MLKPHWRKVLRDFSVNKTRSGLIVLSIAVGLFATGMIVQAGILLNDGLHRGYAAINPSSGIIRTAQTFDPNFVQSVRAMEDVTDADARAHIFTRFQLQPAGGSSAGKEPEGWGDLEIFSVPDYDSLRVNKISPQSGAWPPPPHELLIERSSLALIGAKVGDSLRIETDGSQPQEVRIAGVVHDLIQLPAQFDGSVYVYVSMDTLEALGEPRGFNELHIVVRRPGDPAEVQRVVNLVKDKIENNGMTIPMDLAANPNDLPMGDVLQAILLLLGGLGVLSLGLSAFLIVNTVSALITQQVRQIGVMKAVGARAGQIVRMYLALSALYGAAALILAVPLSILGAWGLSRMLAEMFNFDLAGFRVAPQAIALQLVIGLLIPVLAGLYPTLAVLRVSAAEAMRGSGTGTDRFGQGRFDRLFLGDSFTRFLPRPVLLSLRNTFRRKGRLFLTLAALTLGGAIFIGVLSVRASLARSVNDIIPYRFDLSVALARPEEIARVEQLALGAPHVVEAKGWTQMPVRRVRADGSESQSIFLLAPPVAANRILPAMVEGRWLVSGDDHTVVITSGMLQNEPDLKVGGDMVIRIAGKNVTFHIVGMALGMGMVPTMYADFDDIARITGGAGQASRLMVVTGRPAASDQAQDAASLEKYLEENGVGVRSIQLMTEEGDQVKSIFDIILALALVMALLLAVVGGLGLMGTLSINVLERTREIGVMRAIGASDGAVARVFLVEGEVIGLMSWLLGALLAIPLSALLNWGIGMALLQMPLNSTFSLQGAGLWLIAVGVLAALSSFWPARNASRLTVRDVLAYE